MVWPGAGIAHSRGVLPDFYPTRVNVGLPIPPPLHASQYLCISVLPAVWINVASLNPWLSDFHTAQFSDESGRYLFCSLVVIFAVVVHGGKAYLTEPPSRPEVCQAVIKLVSVTCDQTLPDLDPDLPRITVRSGGD